MSSQVAYTYTVTSGYGGNITLMAGKGGGEHTHDGPPRGGYIAFNLPDGTQYLRIDSDGKCFVKGALVATDVEVHTGFVNWLRSVGFHL